MQKVTDRLKTLNAGKQAVVKRFTHPPGDGIGKEGDMGVAVIPGKGLHFFYKWGGRWYGTRMERNFKTAADDRRLVAPGLVPKSNGELTYSGGTFSVSHGTGKADIRAESIELGHASDTTIARDSAGEISVESNRIYRAGGTNVAIADGGTNADTADAALGNLGGTATGKSVFTAADQAAARSAIGAGTGSGTVTASSTDTFTNKTFDANGTGNSLSNVDLASDVTGNLPDGNIASAGTWNGKTTFFNQDAIPTSLAAGDMWIDSNDSDKLYIAESAGADTIATSKWVKYIGTKVPDSALFTDTNTQLDKSGVEGLAIQTVGDLTSGSIGSGFDEIATARTAAKVTSVTAAGTGLSDGGTTGAVTITVAPDTLAGAITSTGADAIIGEVSADAIAHTQLADFTASNIITSNASGVLRHSSVADTKLSFLNVATAGAVEASKCVVTDASSRVDKVFIDGPAGFVQKTEAWDTGTTLATLDIDFNESNKVYLTPDAASETVSAGRLIFPTAVSGNFVLIFKQHSSGACAVTNWVPYDGDTTGSPVTLWWASGGTKPTLSTGLGHVDILNFYWDAEANLAYGSAVQGFQA